VFHNICNAGVFTTTIDPQQNKVTVTGNVALETLIKKLAKSGKHAEVLPLNLPGKVKDSNKAKNNKKEQKSQETQQKKNLSSANTEPNLNSANDKGIENAEKCNGKSKSTNTKTSAGSPEKSPAGGKGQETKNKSGQGGGGDSGKKKMKKTQSGGGTGTGTGRSNGLSSASTDAPAHTGSEFQSPGQVVGQVNLSPTRQQSYMLYPETCYPPLVQYATYNRLCPMGTMGCPSYYVPPLPYMCAGFDRDPYQFQSTPLIPFEFFSDENANGCSIM